MTSCFVLVISRAGATANHGLFLDQCSVSVVARPAGLVRVCPGHSFALYFWRHAHYKTRTTAASASTTPLPGNPSRSFILPARRTQRPRSMAYRSCRPPRRHSSSCRLDRRTTAARSLPFCPLYSPQTTALFPSTSRRNAPVARSSSPLFRLELGLSHPRIRRRCLCSPRRVQHQRPLAQVSC